MITKKELENLAQLSRIELSESEKDSVVKEFDSILGYIDQLKKVDVAIDTESRVGVVKNVCRDDVTIKISDDTREAILNEAPQREGDFIATKKILE